MRLIGNSALPLCATNNYPRIPLYIKHRERQHHIDSMFTILMHMIYQYYIHHFINND